MSTAERLEELRDLPLVTAADRERYAQWEQEARAELAEVEPADTALDRKKTLVARKYSRATVSAHAYLDVTIDQWRHEWRSMPASDGPPMRAPSLKSIYQRFVGYGR